MSLYLGVIFGRKQMSFQRSWATWSSNAVAAGCNDSKSDTLSFRRRSVGKVHLWMEQTLPNLFDGYELKNVFNADETGLFYKLLPNITLFFKNEPCHSGNHSNNRVTVLVGANADGSEKLPLLVIGKSKKPQCFKNVNSLPVVYDACLDEFYHLYIVVASTRQSLCSATTNCFIAPRQLPRTSRC